MSPTFSTVAARIGTVDDHDLDELDQPWRGRRGDLPEFATNREDGWADPDADDDLADDADDDDLDDDDLDDDDLDDDDLDDDDLDDDDDIFDDDLDDADEE